MRDYRKPGNNKSGFLAVLTILLMLSGPASGLEADNFDNTDSSYSWELSASELDQACTDELGTGWETADWSQLETLYSESTESEFESFMDESGFPSEGSSNFVLRNGDRYYCTDCVDGDEDRAYFASRHDGDTPDHFMVHDDIGDNTLDLGSWNTDRTALCFNENAGGNVIDDFERGDLDPYTFYGSGDSSYISVNSDSSYVYEGDYSLEVQPAGTSSNSIESTAGLNYYAQPGDTVRWRVYFDELNTGTYGSRYDVVMGDSSDGIYLRYSQRDEELQLRNAGGSETVDWRNHMYEWLETEVEWGENQVTAKVMDESGSLIAEVSGDTPSGDGDYMEFGITSSTAGDSTAYFDEVMTGEGSEPPDQPYNPDPGHGEEDVETDPDMSVEVSHPEGVDMDVRFYDDSDNSLIGEDSGVCDECTATVSTSDHALGSEADEEYHWYVVADDGERTTSSSTLEFSTHTSPEPPIDPEPEDGAFTASSVESISAVYQHPDNNPGTVHFWDSETDEKIDECDVGLSGERCGVNWDLSHGENHWFANATDENGLESQDSSTWTLTYNSPPERVQDPENPDDGGKVHDSSVDLEVEVFDDDGDEMLVEFFVNTSGSYEKVGEDTVDDGEIASTDFDIPDRDHLYEWYVDVSDDWNSTESERWDFGVNKLPRIYSYSPRDEEMVDDDQVTLTVTPEDEDDDQVYVYFFNETDDLIHKEQVSSDAGEEASYEWDGLDIGEERSWTVKISDTHENETFGPFSFTRSPPSGFRASHSIDHDYTGLVASTSSVRNIFLTVENSVSISKNLTTYLTGVNAEFAENSENKISYELDELDEREFQVRIMPDEPGDSRELRITTEDNTLGINTTTTIPVHVREYETTVPPSEASGIESLQVVTLLSVSTILYFLLL